jgi:hypothetical protein
MTARPHPITHPSGSFGIGAGRSKSADASAGVVDAQYYSLPILITEIRRLGNRLSSLDRARSSATSANGLPS